MKKLVVLPLVLWLVVAIVVVATGTFARLPVPPPVIIVVLAGAAVLLAVASPAARAWVLSADLRYLLAVHLVRFVGIAFLLLVNRGLLDRAFVPIGWGDAIAATGALVLLAIRPRLQDASGWWAVAAWNVFGFADMLMLIVTGIRLGGAAPQEFALFLSLPFGLLPTFFVPLIIATHVLIFMRLLRVKTAPAARLT